MRIIVGAILVALGASAAGAAPCTELATIRADMEAACPCAGQSSAPGYKSCVKGALKTAAIKGPCKRQMMKTAAKSICGKSGVVVCCKAGKAGKVVKSTKCKGTACTSVAGSGFSLFPLSGADCSAAGACPTTTTTSTSTTVTTTSNTEVSSTTTTLPNLCVGPPPPAPPPTPNNVPEAGEECDDGNLDPTDGCTNECTACNNGTITPPETCEDGNLTSGDGCDANCRTTGCGNGLIVGAETCDDGNTSDNDSCPSDCIVDPCVAEVATDFTVSVNLAGTNINAATVLVDYPEGKVEIPGHESGIPDGILTDYPDFSTNGPNDYDHALLNFILEQSGGTLSGQLFKIHFQTCDGTSAPVAGEFTCVVLNAADAGGFVVTGATCSVTVP